MWGLPQVKWHHYSYRHPIPHIQDFTSNLSGKTTLVCIHHQIPVSKDNIAKTTIITPFDLYKFCCLSFYLRNAAQTFPKVFLALWCPFPCTRPSLTTYTPCPIPHQDLSLQGIGTVCLAQYEARHCPMDLYLPWLSAFESSMTCLSPTEDLPAPNCCHLRVTLTCLLALTDTPDGPRPFQWLMLLLRPALLLSGEAGSRALVHGRRSLLIGNISSHLIFVIPS